MPSAFTQSSISVPVSVANGGTGATTLGDAGVLIGNGTGAVQVTGAGTSGQVLTSNGAGVDPTFQTLPGGSTLAKTFTADEDLTAGMPVGIGAYISSTSSGRIARAIRMTSTATVSYTGNDDNIYQRMVAPIGGDKFVYLNPANDSETLNTTVVSINPATKTVSLGTTVAATADWGNYFAVCGLGTDKFAVVYTEDASTTIVKIRIATVSGTTISYGTAATFATGATAVNALTIARLGTDKGVVWMGCNTSTGSKYFCFTVSTTTATVGAGVTPGTVIKGAVGGIVLQKLDTDKFIAAGTDGGGVGYAQACTVSGTTITAGTEASFGTSVGTTEGFWKTASPATDVFVVTYPGASSGCDIVGATISGTTITFGTPIANTLISTVGNVGLYAVSSSVIMASSTGSLIAKAYSLSGSTITLTGTAISSYLNSVASMVPMDNGYYVACGVSGTTFTTNIQGMSNQFIGVVQSTVSKGNTASVIMKGVDANQSGLVPGQYYTVSSGAFTFLTSTTTVNNAITQSYVKSISATEILI